MKDRHEGAMKRLRKLFIRGFFSILPIAVTMYVIIFFFNILDQFLGKYINKLFDPDIPGIGFLASIILVFLTGFIVTNVVGSRLFEKGEKILYKIPVIPKIYFGTKQILEAFSLQGNQIFNQVALAEYPRKGTYVLGFITGECRGEIQIKTSKKLVNLFIPTTPNPTSGMLILIPEEDVLILDMSVEDGLKLIVSAGVVVPEVSVDKVSDLYQRQKRKQEELFNFKEGHDRTNEFKQNLDQVPFEKFYERTDIENEHPDKASMSRSSKDVRSTIQKSIRFIRNLKKNFLDDADKTEQINRAYKEKNKKRKK